MQRFLADPDVETVDFDGCDFGMQDKDGMPIRKQWKVATTSKELIKHEKGYLHARIEDRLPRQLHSTQVQCARLSLEHGTQTARSRRSRAQCRSKLAYLAR